MKSRRLICAAAAGAMLAGGLARAVDNDGISLAVADSSPGAVASGPSAIASSGAAVPTPTSSLLGTSPVALPVAQPVDETATPDSGSDAASAAPAPKRSISDPNYLLQPDDVVEVGVFREPDLTTDGMVRKDGCFDMKLIGAMKIAGLTVDRAAESIRIALAKDYLVNPRVSLGIVDYAKKKVNILGEVRSPGVYLFPPHGPLALSDAVALSGGFLPVADTSHVEVRRMQGDRLTSIDVDATAGGDSFMLKPDDSISVENLPKRHFTVLGQINRPGSYDIVDTRPVYLLDAIALAGGYTRIANPNRVLLKRTENGHESVLEINAAAMANSPETQRLKLQDQDTITVTESMF